MREGLYVGGVVRCDRCDRPLVVRRGSCALCGETPAVDRLLEAPHAFSNMSARDLAAKLRLTELEQELARGDDGGRRTPVSARQRRSWWTLGKSKQTVVPATWQEAEQLACTWMRENGYRDARLTRQGADNGIDVVSKKAVAQVKFHAQPVGVAEMQRILGIAHGMNRKALFFSHRGYTPKALAWALQHGVALYTFPPVTRVR